MKVLTRYAEKRLKRIRVLLNSFQESNDPEIAHLIRLEIKKIKTLLRVIHYNNKSFKSHASYIPFRTIFRDCEKIREPHVLHTLMMKFTGNTELPSPDSSGAIQQVAETIPAHLRIVRKQERVLLKEIEKIKPHTFKRYLRKKTKTMRGMLYPAFKVSDLHAVRKLIKEIYYLLGIDNKKKSIDPFFKESDILIGGWHDKAIVIQTIRKSDPSQTDLIKKLQQEKRADITRLKRLIKDFLQ